MSFTKSLEKFLSEIVGKGKRFATNAAPARHCGVDTSYSWRMLQMARNMKPESNLGKFAAFLDKVGARVVSDDIVTISSESTVGKVPMLEEKIVLLDKIIALQNDKNELAAQVAHLQAIIASNANEHDALFARIEQLVPDEQEKYNMAQAIDMDIGEFKECLKAKDVKVVAQYIDKILIKNPEVNRTWLYFGVGRERLRYNSSNKAEGEHSETLKELSASRQNVVKIEDSYQNPRVAQG